MFKDKSNYTGQQIFTDKAAGKNKTAYGDVANYLKKHYSEDSADVADFLMEALKVGLNTSDPAAVTRTSKIGPTRRISVTYLYPGKHWFTDLKDDVNQDRWITDIIEFRFEE